MLALTAPARLASFFREFADTRARDSGANRATRLEALFTQLRPLLADDEPVTPPSNRSADEAQLKALFAQLTAPLDDARSTGALANVWSVARLDRNEVRTAAVLAALWNPRVCGTVAIDFLAAFFERLGSPDLPDRAALERGYTITREERPLGDVSERVDIVVETREFLVGIELKIDAPEGPAQLERYRHALQTRLAFKIMPGSGRGQGQRVTAALIYLSRNPDNRSDQAVIGARWRDVAAAARSVVPRRAANRTFVEQLVSHFAAHVSAF